MVRGSITWSESTSPSPHLHTDDVISTHYIKIRSRSTASSCINFALSNTNSKPEKKLRRVTFLLSSPLSLQAVLHEGS